jgi:hypothetical protein
MDLPHVKASIDFYAAVNQAKNEESRNSENPHTPQINHLAPPIQPKIDWSW